MNQPQHILTHFNSVMAALEHDGTDWGRCDRTTSRFLAKSSEPTLLTALTEEDVIEPQPMTARRKPPALTWWSI
jgi:hypothetical protein